MRSMPVDNGELFEQIRLVLDRGLDAGFTVTGNSMWPLFAHGRDRVVLKKIDTPLKKGDIVLFTPLEGRYVLHRIHKMKQGKIQTVGDGCCTPDGEFDPETVLGRVVSFTRKGKQTTCKALRYRLYSRIWRWCFPVRRILLRVLLWCCHWKGEKYYGN